MPGGDGLGPNGMGSMTGRGAGYCAGYNAPGYMNGGFGMGRGFRGRGRGFAYRNWDAARPRYMARDYYSTEPIDEQKYLEQQQKLLRNRLEAIEEQLKILKDQE